nr:hypothetical protein [Sphingobacterium sp. E70]
MTLDMLKSVGIQHEWTANEIHIAPQTFSKSTIYVEPDWSAASYWYAIVALAEDGASIVLPGLKKTVCKEILQLSISCPILACNPVLKPMACIFIKQQ